MFCFRRWWLILSLLILGAGQALAASREDRAFDTAAAAFQDELWGRAETQFSQFIQRFPNSSRQAEAVLLMAQAQFQQGKYTAAINSLSASWANPGKLADRYTYWTAEAEFKQGDFERAAKTFALLPEKYPQSPLGLTAVVEAAAACERLGDWPRVVALLGGTNAVFARFTAGGSTNELVARGGLLLARAQLEQRSYADALATLKSLEDAPLSPDLGWQRVNLLVRVQAGMGELDAALVATTNLLELARSQDAARLADSVAWRATVLEQLGRWAEAGEVWTNNLAASAPPEWQQEAVLRMARAAAAQKDFTSAEAALENYLVKYSNAPAASIGRMTLGELQLKDYLAGAAATNKLAPALANFEQVLGATNDAAAQKLTGKALLDRGWCRWLTGNYAASLADFQGAKERLPFSEDLAVAMFKTGDAQFALKAFAEARQSYQEMLDKFDRVPAVKDALGARALYQVLRSSLELKDMTGADAAMRRMLAEYPASNLTDNSLLLLGEGFAEAGSAPDALKLYADFAVLFPQSPLTPLVELARARACERAGDWAAAVTNYQGWLASYPTNALRPEVEYALGRASFQGGDEEGALAVFTNFVAHYPADTNAPLAQWWVADHFFRLGGTNYSEAEKNYELIFQTPAWRSVTNLYYQSQLMAGRAAEARQGFADAAKYYLDAANSLTQLMGETNRTPQLEALKTRALFAYGGVLMRWDSPDTNNPLANFELATNVFYGLYQSNPTNALGALACSELGDCSLQLGVLDAATNAYFQVMNSPYAGAGLRSRALVGLGIVFEKMAESAGAEDKASLLNRALNCYLDVLDEKNLRDGETADLAWTKKAGLQALPLMRLLNTGDVDKFIKRLEDRLPELTEMLEKKRAAMTN
jgi:TolA-binding protein